MLLTDDSKIHIVVFSRGGFEIHPALIKSRLTCMNVLNMKVWQYGFCFIMWDLIYRIFLNLKICSFSKPTLLITPSFSIFRTSRSSIVTEIVIGSKTFNISGGLWKRFGLLELSMVIEIHSFTVVNYQKWK